MKQIRRNSVYSKGKEQVNGLPTDIQEILKMKKHGDVKIILQQTQKPNK